MSTRLRTDIQRRPQPWEDTVTAEFARALEHENIKLRAALNEAADDYAQPLPDVTTLHDVPWWKPWKKRKIEQELIEALNRAREEKAQEWYKLLSQ